MENLINIAIDKFLSNFFARIKYGLITSFMNLIELVSSNLLKLFDTPIIVDFMYAGIWISRILFGATIFILLIDILEENGSWKSDQFKVIEWTTIFLNLMKAAVFVEAAPRFAILAIHLTVGSVSSFDPKPYLTGIPINGTSLLAIIIGIVAVGGFAITTLMRFVAILIQAFSSFLYVPDIVRGHTTSMGSWIRQTVAIVLTFFLQYTLFFMGLVCFCESEIILACALWIGMFLCAKYLDKFGMSTGVTGALSSSISMAQSASNAISMFTA